MVLQMRKIRRFARFVVSQSTSQRLLAIGWDLTADYLFPMVELNGERGITTITAPRMTAALQAHLRAGGMHSKTQKCVTLSTTQAEYVAMSDVAKEILFLRQVWRFMLPRAGMPCIPLFEDNEGAIQIAKHPISNSNSKHIDVRHHFLRELVERKEIEIIHAASQYQHADFLTKALPEREFEFQRGIVMNLM